MLNIVEKYRSTLGVMGTRGFSPPAEESNCRRVVYGDESF